MKLVLPIPPANNRYYRHAGGRTYLSGEARRYKSLVAGARLVNETITGPVSITISVYARDKRRRDLDGYPKAIFDALTFAKIWNDDSQVDEMRVVRMPHDRKNPRVELEIINL